MQLWSRGIPGGLVDAVSWPVVCNHSPTSHFVKGIHHWRQKSNLQAAMSIWAIGFKWAIPRKCHAFLGLGVFKTTVLVGEYFLNLFTSFGSSNWSRKHILRHIGILYHVFVHDVWYIFIPAQNPFPHSFPFMRGFSLQWTATFEMSWNPTRAYFWFWHITILVTLKHPNPTYQQTQTHDAKRPKALEEINKFESFPVTLVFKVPKAHRPLRVKPVVPKKVPRFDDFRWPWWTFQVLRMQHFCCPNWRCGWYAMPKGLLFVVDDLTTKKLGISNYIVDVVRNCM